MIDAYGLCAWGREVRDFALANGYGYERSARAGRLATWLEAAEDAGVGAYERAVSLDNAGKVA